MKLKILLFFIFIYALNINAQSYIAYPQEGVYAGIESGVALVYFNGTYDTERPNSNNEEFLSDDFTKSVIGINVGYGKYLGENFVGLEIHHSLYTKKIDQNLHFHTVYFDYLQRKESLFSIIQILYNQNIAAYSFYLYI